MQRKTLLLITMSLCEKDGCGRYCLGVIREIQHYYDLVIISQRQAPLAPFVRHHPRMRIFQILPSHWQLMKPWQALFYAMRILTLGIRFDAVHSLMDYPHAFVAFLVASATNKPLFISSHGTYSVRPLYLARQAPFLRMAFRKARRIFCISRYTKREIRKRLPLSQLMVVPNGIDLDYFATACNVPVQRPPDAPLSILSVGELKKRKGFDILIKACAQLKSQLPHFQCTIVGAVHSEFFLASLQALAQRLGVAAQIHFTREISEQELFALYRQCDVFVLTSRDDQHNIEGFGLVYLEAGAFGKPVIGARQTGAEEPIIHGFNGLLVPPEDPDSTAQALLTLLRDRQLREQMGAAGRQRCQQLSWHNVVAAMLDAYAQYL